MKEQLTFNKMRKRILSGKLAIAIAVTLSSVMSFGQTVTTSVATGTNTTGNLPIYGYYGYTYSQQIYLASDFDAAVAGQVNRITKIRFFNTSGSLTSATSWTVFMGSTSQTSFSNTASWIPVTSMTQVFSGTLTAPAANTWMEITLSTPFIWDGVSNVVVAVDENTSGYSTINWRSHSTGADRSMNYYSDSNNPNPASPPAGIDRFSYVPQAQFVHEIAPACAGTPVHKTANTSVSTICSNSTSPVNLSFTGSDFANGLTYQWQYNNGAGWTNYPSATNTTYSTQPTQTVNVRVITTCSATNDRDTSEEASITVNAAPTVAANYTAVAYCTGTPAQVIANGAATYAWAPATGLNVANNDTVNANPANPTTYTVIGTDLAGCKDTATVMVTPVSKITKTASYSPSTICTPGTPVTVTASAAPAVLFGGGSYEYRFIGANGAELQSWNATGAYNFVPGADSVYKIYYDVRSTTCPDAIDSSLISVVVGFGATVNVVDYDCNNLGGAVTLSNSFGQVTMNTVYSNPFANATTDLTNVTLLGGAAITGGRMVITPSVTSIGSASAIIQDPNFHTGANNAMTLSFKLTADQPINVFNTGGADGLTYSFADDISNTGNQNGSGSKLRLVFDAAGNGSNSPGIYLVYGNTGGVSATSVTPGATSTLYYSSNTAGWKLMTDVQVVLTIDVAGKASLTLDGVTIFSNVQMPAAYMNANTSTWKQVFSAATGGDALRQAISNVVVTAPTSQVAMVPANQTPATWQSGLTFSNVQPGTYDIWMSSNSSTSCAKKIKTIVVENLNPLVLLGNDTTICQGEVLTLDAGNPGSSYVWSNSQVTTQTRAVTQSGAYVVYVTNADGCTGIGSVNVTVNNIPAANSALYVQNNMPTYTFTVLNPQNVDSYSWNFGDGSTLTNAPSTATHTYTVAGPYMVTATLTNECGTQTVIQTIVVTSTAGIEENGIEGLSVYPNPASDKVTISIPETVAASATVYSTTGTLVSTIEKLDAQTELSVQGWTPGVYFVRVQNESKTSTIKLVIQ
ncbi:T9SS type A sorting domain-containing protein [Fluviicola sp.]|uniref:T9SS type A sorting domain-containing protein n=1 Tax=Fluviicola sp. TaxID=1917219 RepID=UPI0026224A90|nr:T9SS type A sorting domain-containing protein [Fluviicola sp.]